MPEMIHIESIYGARTGEPLVELRWGAEEGQFTPDEARAHALRVLEAAEAAEQDAFLMDWLLHQVGVIDVEKRAMMLKHFRAWREARKPAEKR